MSDQSLLKLDCGMDLCLPRSGTETSMQSVKGVLDGVYSMILSTWNFEYDLQLQRTKRILFRYVRHTIRLFMLFPFQIPFCSFRTVKLIKNNAFCSVYL